MKVVQNKCIFASQIKDYDRLRLNVLEPIANHSYSGLNELPVNRIVMYKP